MSVPSGRPFSAPASLRRAIGDFGPSAWAFARAVLGTDDAADRALRAAFRAVGRSSVHRQLTQATLLVATGRATAMIGRTDRLLDPQSPFVRAFAAVPWPVQVAAWGLTIDGTPATVLADALGPDAAAVWDPSTQLALAYLDAAAMTAPPLCRGPILDTAARLRARKGASMIEIDPHFRACPTCAGLLPLRVGAELSALASPDVAVPGLLRQRILLDSAAPSALSSRGKAVAVGVVAVAAVVAGLLASHGGHANAGARLAASPSTSPANSSVVSGAVQQPATASGTEPAQPPSETSTTAWHPERTISKPGLGRLGVPFPHTSATPVTPPSVVPEPTTSAAAPTSTTPPSTTPTTVHTTTTFIPVEPVTLPPTTTAPTTTTPDSTTTPSTTSSTTAPTSTTSTTLATTTTG